LRTLEACATIRDEHCTELMTGGGSFQRAALAECVLEKCSPYCQAVPPGAGESETSCKESPLAPAAACSCTVQSIPANDFTCSEAVERGSRCCAPSGWPAPGLQCTCRRLSCNPTEDGCFCSLVDYAPEQETCAGQAHCCLAAGHDDQCFCRSRECGPNETPVPACSLDVMGCGSQVKQESCSRRSVKQ
jgi:hypothetical protein